MLRSGIGLGDALHSLGSASGSRSQVLLGRLSDHVKGGASLGEALKREPNVFSRADVARVRAAEGIGHPETALEQIAESIDTRLQVRARLLSKATYPCFLVIMWIFIGPLGLLVMGATGAYFAKVALHLTGLFVLVGGCFFGIPRLLRATGGRDALCRLAWVGPWPSGVYRDITRGLFCRLLSDHLEAGRGIHDALHDAAEGTGDETLQGRAKDAVARVRGGASLTDAIMGTGLLLARDRLVVHSGEQAGQLPECLRGLAVIHDERALQGREMLIRVVGGMILLMGLFYVAAEIIDAFQNILGGTERALDAMDLETPVRYR